MTAAEMSENILLSPASVYQTLTLAYFGAEGQTQREIADLILSNNGSYDKVSRSDVASNYLFERAFFALREMDPNLGYELVHANK